MTPEKSKIVIFSIHKKEDDSKCQSYLTACGKLQVPLSTKSRACISKRKIYVAFPTSKYKYFQPYSAVLNEASSNYIILHFRAPGAVPKRKIVQDSSSVSNLYTIDYQPNMTKLNVHQWTFGNSLLRWRDKASTCNSCNEFKLLSLATRNELPTEIRNRQETIHDRNHEICT